MKEQLQTVVVHLTDTKHHFDRTSTLSNVSSHYVEQGFYVVEHTDDDGTAYIRRYALHTVWKVVEGPQP